MHTRVGPHLDGGRSIRAWHPLPYALSCVRDRDGQLYGVRASRWEDAPPSWPGGCLGRWRLFGDHAYP